jgi:hypothetical protein
MGRLSRFAAKAARKAAVTAASKAEDKGAKAPEMVVTPKAKSKPPSLLSAVRVGGKTYTGPTHLDALDAIPDPKVRSQASLDANSRGFVNERGKYMDRFKAADYARNFDLFSPDAPDWAKTAPEVISENLRLPEIAVTPKVSTTPAQPKPPRKKIEVYHGTPHRFEPEVKVRNTDDGFEFYRPRPSDLRVSPGLEVVEDYPLGRFRIDKMGTGAGPQMYGRGIYATEAPDIARTYRQGIRPAGAANPTIGGVDANLAYANLVEKADRLPIAAGRPLYDQAALLENIINTGDLLDVEKAMAAGDYAPDTADWFNREIAGKWDAPGALYQVGLDVDPANMLAWDTPLKEQPQVLEALGSLLQRYGVGEEDLLHGKYPMTGGDVYNRLSFRSDIQPKAMADMLTGAGLSGIRYLDPSARSRGDGPENYVIMNPELLEIMKRYNMGGAVEGME